MKEEAETDDDGKLESYTEATCTVCFAEFLDMEDLALHAEQMHPPHRKYCQLCSEVYSDLLEYAAHVRDHHFADLRCCDHCWKVFVDERDLQAHSIKHTKIVNFYSCSQCDYMYDKAVQLRFHEEKSHNNNLDGVYLLCMPHLASILNLKIIPLLQTEGNNEFECIRCEYKSKDFSDYKKHLQKSKCMSLFACDRCSSVFKQKKSIVKHLSRTKICLRVEKYIEKPFQCNNCKKTVHPAFIKHHIKTNCNIFQCNQCATVCDSVTELSEHQTRNHPVELDILRCKFCPKEFISNVPLRKHIERVHKPDFPLYKYKCTTCNAVFKHPQKLFAHFYTQHKELEPFTCKICNKKFRVRKGFTLHIKLDHKSVGFVEFDDQYHVFFTENKSEKPFIPKCVLPEKDLAQNDEEDKNTSSVRMAQILDTDVTEAETEDDRKAPKKRISLKRKLQTKQTQHKQLKKNETQSVAVESSDDEPLLEIRKRVKKVRKVRKTTQWKWRKGKSKQLYVCKICDRNCYTYQNHQNHMNLHNKKQQIKCIKCSETFKTTDDLNEHMNTEHATSKLTETLKNLLNKKKQVKHNPIQDPKIPDKFSKTNTEKFKIAMKKVVFESSPISAKITPVSKELSVKNFLENFTPDVSEPKEKVKIYSSVSIKKCSPSIISKPTIKLTRFKNPPINNDVFLRMPQKFKPGESVKTKISIKLVQQQISKDSDFILPDFSHSDNLKNNDNANNDNYDNDNTDSYEVDINNYDKDDIPEMAHEVSLEGTEEPPRNVQVPTKIILPKLPKGYSKIHVATLQPEAPYFKIIKIDSDKGTVTDKTLPVEKKALPKDDIITLPSGGKLVTANPLAHLLTKPVEEIMEEKYKYYKPVNRDFKGMLANAMKKLAEGPPPKKPTAKKPERVKKPKPPPKDYKGMVKNAMKKLATPPVKKIKGKINEDIGETEEVIDETEEVIGEHEDVIDETEEVIGETEEVIGENEEVIGENEDVIDENEEVIGEEYIEMENEVEETEMEVDETENNVSEI